jgi:hypothetical protein
VAARYKPKHYTFLSASPVSLGSILASPNDSYVGSITLRAASDNSQTLYWGDNTELGGYLRPGEAASFDLTGKFVATADIYLVGATNDEVYITVIG